MELKLNLTQQKHAFINQKKCTTTQNKHEKTKARFSRLVRQPAWERSGSILKGKDKGRDTVSKEREEKGISGEAYDINKQTIYIAQKSKLESGRIMFRSLHGAAAMRAVATVTVAACLHLPWLLVSPNHQKGPKWPSVCLSRGV